MTYSACACARLQSQSGQKQAYSKVSESGLIDRKTNKKSPPKGGWRAEGQLGAGCSEQSPS